MTTNWCNYPTKKDENRYPFCYKKKYSVERLVFYGIIKSKKKTKFFQKIKKTNATNVYHKAKRNL